MTTELYHYGILGMKWGVRRYQNYDGSLTARGKKRYSSEGGTGAKVEAIKAERKKSLKSKSYMLLSNDELREGITRMDLEKRYKELLKSDTQPGYESAMAILQASGGTIAKNAALGSLAYLGKYAVTGVYDAAEYAKYAFPNPNAKKK